MFTMSDGFHPFLKKTEQEVWSSYSSLVPEMRVNEETNELFLYGTIVSQDEKKFMEMYGVKDIVTSLSLKEDLDKLTGDINLKVNSPGGNVNEASAFHAALIERRNKGDKVHVSVDGYAGSAASFIILAGNTIKIAQMGAIMIHRTAVSYWGPMRKQELEKLESALMSIDNAVVKLYTERLDLTEKKVFEYMDEEKRFNAEEALKVGFVDEILKVKKDPVVNPNMNALSNHTLLQMTQ